MAIASGTGDGVFWGKSMTGVWIDEGDDCCWARFLSPAGELTDTTNSRASESEEGMAV